MSNLKFWKEQWNKVTNTDSVLDISSILESESADQLTSRGLTSFGKDGFLDVMLNTNKRVSIAQYTRVSNVKFNSDKTREEFMLLEWPYANKLASVACETKGVSRFATIQYESAAKIYFDKTKGELTLGSIKVPAYTSESDPIPNGSHNIWLPDYYHSYGIPYLSSSKFAGIWYRLGSESSERYLHVGSVSNGCVSVGKSKYSDTNSKHRKWDLVYDFLSKKRLNYKHIGKLIVS